MPGRFAYHGRMSGGGTSGVGGFLRAGLLFAVNTVVQMLLVGAEWLDAYGFTYQGPVEDFGPVAFVLVLLYPVAFTVFILLGMLVLPGTRRTARSLLVGRDAWVLYIGLAIGAVLIYVVDQYWAGVVISWLGVAWAAFTQLGVEEEGPQPWLGLTFLVIGYVLGLYFGLNFVAEDGEPEFSLPTSLLGWFSTIVGAAIVGWGMVQHWRNSRRRVPPGYPPAPPGYPPAPPGYPPASGGFGYS